MSVDENVQRFRMTMLLEMPYYGEIISRVPFISDNTIPTAQTNGLQVRYNPDFLGKMRAGQQNFVLMHELFHILLQHGKRSGKKRPDLWNAACDLVVNRMLEDMIPEMTARGLPFEKPDNGLFTERRYHRSADDYYEELAELNRKKSKDHKIRFIIRRVWHADPVIGEAEKPNDLPSEEETVQISPELMEILRQAMGNYQKSAVPGIGSCTIPKELMEITIRKPLPWRILLKNMLQEYEDDSDSSWATPERKYIHMDLLLPGHCRSENETLGEVWAFVDSSGSISKQEMDRFLNELWHLLHDFRCTMNIAYWQTAVDDVYTRIDSEKKLKECVPRHTGGTDINCVYRYISDQKLKPEVVIILTDGCFGQLKDPRCLRALRQKTVMVLSTKNDPYAFSMYGKVAAL